MRAVFLLSGQATMSHLRSLPIFPLVLAMTTSKRLTDPFGSRDTFRAPQGQLGIYRLAKLEKDGLAPVSGGRGVGVGFRSRLLGVPPGEIRRPPIGANDQRLLGVM